jgi:hypothetical protein
MAKSKAWPVAVLLLAACSDLKFQVRQQDIMMSDIVGLEKSVTVQGQADFYWAGFYPSSQTIWADQEIMKYSTLQHLAALEIKTFRTWGDWLAMLFTLGLYVPVHYELTARGVDYGDY